LQKNDRLANIPVIVMTGRESADTRDRAMESGAVAFFQKPVDDGKLMLAIWKALDGSRGVVNSDD
jgi:FixJ family two-component response regulator